jgi:predicted Fe-Mo cluster-binding NifX family protein
MNHISNKYYFWHPICILLLMKEKEGEGKIAVTVWEHRISPVFDSGRTLLIAEIKDNVLVSTSYLSFDFDRPFELLRMLRAEKVKIIICGAIAEGPASMLLAAGFKLFSFIAGDVDQVLEALVQGNPLDDNFKMPGCGKNICCRGKIRHGRGIGILNNNGGRGKSRQRPSPPATAEIGDDSNDHATSAVMSVRLSGES